MSVYSSRLVGPVLNTAAGAWATVGTVPAGKVWVIRHVSLVNSGADTSVAWLAVNGTASGNRVFLRSMPTSTDVQQELRLVLAAGETLRYRTTTTALLGTCLTVSGYELGA